MVDENKYKIGDLISGKITGITKYGIFLKIDDEYSGMIHISEISGKYINDLEKIYVLDEEIEANVLSIDEEKKQIKLSTKSLNSKNKRKKSIKEEGRGFEPLKENLDKWVSEKLSDIEKKQKTQ